MKADIDLMEVNGYTIYVEKHFKKENKKTAIMVNGALSTTTSFRNCVKHLGNSLNFILFDLPFTGGSKKHNEGSYILTKEEEVSILLFLIEHYRPHFLVSVSWGGYAALMALAHQPPSIEKAAIASFATHLNGPMKEYLLRAKHLADDKKFEDVAILMNNEVGKYLPRIIKYINKKHISTLDQREYNQAYFHINQVLEAGTVDYSDIWSNINTPVVFINGEKDEHTPPSSARRLENSISSCEFKVIKEAGHFLDIENRVAHNNLMSTLREVFAIA
ncbi:alpha/beta fold hydrolase [Halomonas binhaiensis]|uniref:Alpha/beta hydrolase n=1 Tax=Halomonas binhaiensis TaxID=2562282 RepID=A0A5C1NDF4_9GAMM|nr:alpha/beta hydrolase [Halomonas binhaiensis]QEM80910.1 alpha/beta hydrolase [Halomonas binhaiensis]